MPECKECNKVYTASYKWEAHLERHGIVPDNYHLFQNGYPVVQEQQVDYERGDSGDEESANPLAEEELDHIKHTPHGIADILGLPSISTTTNLSDLRESVRANPEMLPEIIRSLTTFLTPPPVAEATIAVAEADQDAINRLKEMGFPEQLVIEAYLACDKNEGLAVNYIQSRMNDDIENDAA